MPFEFSATPQMGSVGRVTAAFGSDEKVASRERWALGAIIVAGVVLRLVRLGHLSFAGDEETTTLAALALLDGWPPTLPGGLVYVRGLPFTLLEAASIAALGVSETALRLFPVLFAGPRIFATWWLARPFLGWRYALLAAALIGLAPLDVEQSRNARMYSMFAALDLLAVAAAIHTALGSKRARTALLCGTAAIATHIVAVTHAVVPFAAALGRGLTLRRRALLFGVGGGLALSFVFFKRLSQWAYAMGQKVEATSSAKVGPVGEHAASLAALVREGAAATPVVLGIVGAAILGFLAARRLEGRLPRVAAVVSVAAFALASPVLGAVALLATLLLAEIPPGASLQRAPLLLLAAASATAGWGLAGLAAHGLSAGGVADTAEFLLGFPAPNWYEMAAAAPLLFALALLGAWVAADEGARAERPGVWLAFIVAAFGPALISGIIDRKAGLRFQLHTVAPLIILALLAARWLVLRLKLSVSAGLVAATLMVGCALRPDYSLRAVLREHGPVDSPYAAPVAPDHRGAAAFVRAHAADDEWIAAEDPLQQHLLIGRTELWLRRFDDARGFVRVDPRDGTLREVYTGSRLVTDLDALRELSAEEEQSVVWLITSGESEARPEWYRTDETNAKLLEWRPLAWFEGADGLTRVYRLVDGEPVPPRQFGELR